VPPPDPAQKNTYKLPATLTANTFSSAQNLIQKYNETGSLLFKVGDKKLPMAGNILMSKGNTGFEMRDTGKGTIAWRKPEAGYVRKDLDSRYRIDS